MISLANSACFSRNEKMKKTNTEKIKRIKILLYKGVLQFWHMMLRLPTTKNIFFESVA